MQLMSFALENTECVRFQGWVKGCGGGDSEEVDELIISEALGSTRIA